MDIIVAEDDAAARRIVMKALGEIVHLYFDLDCAVRS